MYEMMLGLFVLIAILSLVAIIKYGFNVIFLYILLFSAAVIVWAVAAILEERKAGRDGN